MYELRHPFPAAVADLFDPAMVNAASAWGVLEGNLPGVIAVDNPTRPTWAVGRMYWNIGFAAGRIDCSPAATAARDLTRWGDFDLFRGASEPDVPGGEACRDRIEFVGPRRASTPAPPTGCRVEAIDATLLRRCLWGEGTGAIWGGGERFVERGVGRCLLRGGDILCEVYTFAIGAGRAELSVVTRPDVRGRGYAKATCAHAAAACEARGLLPTYSCDRDHHASVAVARSLRFADERPCRGLSYRPGK